MNEAPSLEFARATRRDMLAEARVIIDAARERGIVLRLFGGLAVRTHCTVIAFCERDYADLDMVGLARQANEIVDFMEGLGYSENVLVRQASDGHQRQFYRSCEHSDAGAHFFAHPDDHIDVFLDTFRMDHAIPLAERLTLDNYTISATDTLLTKLQIYRLTEKDLRDVLTLLKDLDLASDDRPGTINVAYIAERCAHDWGLFHDVMKNLERCHARVATYGLSQSDVERIRSNLARLVEALEATAKPLAWRLRAKIGTHRPWHNQVEQ
jgi:hypothetical protein